MVKLYILFWWVGGQRKPGSDLGAIEWITPPTPHGAIFTNELAAKAAASVRNAMMITVDSPGQPEIEGADWYRKDDEGNPMPVQWRDLTAGKPGIGWPHLPRGRRLQRTSQGDRAER